ncbi:cytochrome P450 4g1-like isoform X2 [Euwallacea similis]|uniref:cytochrome P450 4g1-like isoform X2 n=1 Tax=Euwallacea similis TaxID=1736056 RepID=UPI00344FF5AB
MLSLGMQFMTHSFTSVLNPFVSILLGIILILTIYHFWFQSLRYVKMAKNIPGPKPIPILGNALEVLGLGPEGERWKSHRKMLAPTFHSSILKTFIPIFNRNFNTLLKKLDKIKHVTFDVFEYTTSTTVDILLETAMGVKAKDDNVGLKYAKAIMDMCYIVHQRHYNLWLRISFFFRWTKMAKEQTKLLNIIQSLTRRVLKSKKEDYVKRVEKGEHSIYNEVVAEAAKNQNDTENERTENYSYIRDDLEDNEENDVGKKKRLAFLDFMVEASQIEGNKLTDDDIEDEVSTITFAGHDTISAASSFIFTLLGIHQDIQEKCIIELKEIFHDDWNRSITFKDTIEMKYLERVIMETLRLYPPVPLIARKINEDVKLASRDITLPAGTTVVISQYVNHRDPKIWTNPEKFDPDNFLPEKCQARHHYAYFPFSAGPRSCLGRKYAMLQLKVMIATVLRKYKLISPKEEKDFRLQSDIILKRADGFDLRVEDRIV